MWLLEDKKVQSFYTAMYPIYEKESLLLKFKLSGTKSQEIAESIKMFMIVLTNGFLFIRIQKSLFPIPLLRRDVYI